MDAKWFDFVRRADFDDEAAVLYSAEDAGVQDENFHRACTWFFRAKARLPPAKTWKDVLHSRKNRQKECMDAASDITFACYDIITGPDLGTTSIEGYVHGDVPIRLGSLKRWLPIKHPDLPELLEIAFEAILPGRKPHNQRYTKHPTILKFLTETTTMPSDTSKRLRVDFCGTSEELVHENHERANTWFLRAKVGSRNFADVLKDREQRQATSLQAASYIAYACSPHSDRPGTMQVEMLVHAKASKNIRRGTLLGWLADSVHVEHLEAEPIHPGRNRPFTSHETVARFYAETTSGLGRSPLTAKGAWKV